MRRRPILSALLRSREPSVRWKVRSKVLDTKDNRPEMRTLRELIRRAPRTRSLLNETVRQGRQHALPGVYYKWLGDHWVFATLADLGYPRGDRALGSRVARAVDYWLKPEYFREFRAVSMREASRSGKGVPVLRGKHRRCASQQGNALFYAATLGFVPGACDRLAERLIHWQWPDGGWNCDPDPDARTSSFGETLLPMVGLATFGRQSGHAPSLAAARRASEVFLQRQLFRRRSDGSVIRREFTRLHYPLYWHYDILGCLKALAPMGLLSDPRCREALDLLESKELSTGGWSMESRYFDLDGEAPRRGRDKVRWGTTDGTMNEWVTADALAVLRAAGRLDS